MPKVEIPENKTLGPMQEQRAVVLAGKLDVPLMAEVNRLNVAKQDWEGGAFEVMARIVSTLSAEDASSLPDPHDKTGNNPAYYYVPVTRINAKGKSVTDWKERYFYKELTLNLPGIVAKTSLKSQIERSLQPSDKVNQSDIPEYIMAWSPDYRRAQITKLTNEVNNAVKAVVSAFELYFQLTKFNENIRHVSATPVYAIGPDGKEMDGQEGRPFKVEATTLPILIRTTVKSRQLHDVEALSIQSFLKIDIAKAVEGGGTFEAVKNTLKRIKSDQTEQGGGTGNVQDQSRPQSVNTPDTALARISDVNEYFDRIAREKTKAAWDQLDKELHGAGSDEAFLAARDVRDYLNRLVGSPADDKRYAELTSASAEEAA